MLQSHPDILDGTVCFSGTRIPVGSVWSFAAVGYDAKDIQREYPSLSIAEIQGALEMVEWKNA